MKARLPVCLQMDCAIIFRFMLLYIFLVTEEITTTFAADTTTTRTSLLRCYDCQVTYKDVWTPYSPCQTNVTSVDIATCLQKDKYCKVEHIRVKGATISLTRECADTCYYGCRLRGFGVTQLRCSSCCTQSLCNTDAGAFSPVHLSSEVSKWILQRVLGCVTLTLYLTYYH